jgi:hypothetical protein
MMTYGNVRDRIALDSCRCNETKAGPTMAQSADLHPEFVIDAHRFRKSLILRIGEYEALLENFEHIR